MVPSDQPASTDWVAFPLGGIGAGTMCLSGVGALTHVSIQHRPDFNHEPPFFAAVASAGDGGNGWARVLEGPMPRRKIGPDGNGMGGSTAGLPRFRQHRFQARFPFATVDLNDANTPVAASLTGWSPLIPTQADRSSLPALALEYTLTNRTAQPLAVTFSYHAPHFLKRPAEPGRDDDSVIRPIEGGFVLHQPGSAQSPQQEAALAVFVNEPGTTTHCAWFRGGWFDTPTMLWNDVASGRCVSSPPHREGGSGRGASLFVPMTLPAGGSATVRVHLCWYVPMSSLQYGHACDPNSPARPEACYRPWYASRFRNIDEVVAYWRSESDALRHDTQIFADCFHDSTLPAEVVHAVAANLGILRSPTVLRQHDGAVWAWEGCHDKSGCCAGSCTHVWNYAQALPHLFPDLERTLRETEYEFSQDESGHQAHRSALPIAPIGHDFHAAADGQLGGVMKLYRDWRISGDTAWLQRLWPRARQSLLYAIRTWDPDQLGVLVEPHHNTYDIEFWGPDGMGSSFYLGALAAGIRMGRVCSDDVSLFETILARGQRYMQTQLFNGEYFEQQVRWQGLRAGDPVEASRKSMGGHYSPEALQLLQEEGPKYQYGRGCLSDGVLGAWLAGVCGIDELILDPEMIASHLQAVYRYNLRRDLTDHVNPQRPSYALGDEGGLLLCTWPRGGKPKLPFVYSDEVWTGIEYQVASHLIRTGHVREGLEIVRIARKRYDGRIRNPFDEYECGHWYARAMASYSLIEALSGARYDAVEQVLYLSPRVKGDFRSFLSTATGFGTVGLRGGEPFVEVRYGTIAVREIRYAPQVSSTR